ncbi:DUF397 domain-containing protein [Micromonospora sp. NPDC047740]|uniref:DUF397 domain-containing protein n=1 Tax=Micromonospora sp. NPDC047740 TaxID=3364254 RepID=UPI00371B770D
MARTWWTCARSGDNGDNCVEVADNLPAVVVCDSKDRRRAGKQSYGSVYPGRPALIVDSRSWAVAGRSPDRL